MSLAQHPGAAALRALGVTTIKPVQKPEAPKPDEPEVNHLDSAGAAADYALADIRAQTVALVQDWASTPADDLDEGETLSDRLDAMLVGVADSNKDGEITEDEANIIDIALGAAWDYLSSKGAADEDIDALLNEGSEEAAARVAELISSAVPPEDAEALADLDTFVFDGEAQESVFDSAMMVLDATYKKAWAVRSGKKVRINKRISGTVKLSPKQKAAIRKAQTKMHSAAARMSRMKSLRVRSKLGLNK